MKLLIQAMYFSKLISHYNVRKVLNSMCYDSQDEECLLTKLETHTRARPINLHSIISLGNEVQ